MSAAVIQQPSEREELQLRLIEGRLREMALAGDARSQARYDGR